MFMPLPLSLASLIETYICYGLNWASPHHTRNSYGEFLTPVLQNVTTFGDGAFKELIK